MRYSPSGLCENQDAAASEGAQSLPQVHGAAASATAVMPSTVALATPRTRARRERCTGPAAAQALGLVGGRDADGALGLAEAVEVVAIAVVEVAVEGFLFGETLGGVGPDGGADVAEDGWG